SVSGKPTRGTSRHSSIRVQNSGLHAASLSTRQSRAPIRTSLVPQRTQGLRQRRSITRACRLERRWPKIRQINRAITRAAPADRIEDRTANGLFGLSKALQSRELTAQKLSASAA